MKKQLMKLAVGMAVISTASAERIYTSQNESKIADEGLSTTAASASGGHLWEPWYFLRDYDKHNADINTAIQYIWERVESYDKPDISDADMVYYLVNGDLKANPSKLKVLFESGFDGKFAPLGRTK